MLRVSPVEEKSYKEKICRKCTNIFCHPERRRRFLWASVRKGQLFGRFSGIKYPGYVGNIIPQNRRKSKIMHPDMHCHPQRQTIQIPVENHHFCTLSTDFSTRVFHSGQAVEICSFDLHKKMRQLSTFSPFFRRS